MKTVQYKASDTWQVLLVADANAFDFGDGKLYTTPLLRLASTFPFSMQCSAMQCQYLDL